jgi:hypothetical protein
LAGALWATVAARLGLAAAALREALAAMPNLRGNFHRKMPPLPDAALARCKVGDTIVERFFISTSKEG